MIPETSVIEAGDLQFHGLSAGSGAPALLLHGFPDTPHSFASQVEHLSERRFSVFAPALRGYPPTGGSGPFGLDQLANDAIELLRAMGATKEAPGVLIGHDWGGIVACAAAAGCPELISRLVVMSVPHPMVMGAKLLGGDFGQLKRSWYMFLFQMPGLSEAVVSGNDFAFLEQLMLDWSPNLIENEGSEEVERRKTMLAEPGVLTSALGYYRAMFGDQQVAVGAVQVPSMFIFGEDDGCIPASICDGMEALFPGGYQLEVVKRAGHFVPSEAPDEVNALLSDFLDG